MYSLVLTLGHNSSAILLENGSIICGYENERLSGIKSDSNFPSQAIQRIISIYALNSENVEGIYISHWDTFADIDGMSDKHWKPEFLNYKFRDVPIYSHGLDITHHDAHMLAARVFAEETKEWEIVADGFGNYNEALSLYYKGTLVHRAFGYDKSLGLFFQYTTAFLGLKMNQDEYKLLGYESHIKEVVSPEQRDNLYNLASKFSKKFFTSMINGSLKPEYDSIAGIEALPNHRVFIHEHLTDVVKRFKIKDDMIKKVVISYYAQSVLELVMIQLIRHYDINDVTLSGGVFMNVKLNNVISQMVDKLCVYPICGDQGAGLGVYQFYRGDLKPITHLFWGKRNLRNFSYTNDKLKKVNVEDLLDVASGYLRNDYIVNVVKGNMEFGARALGNTSTLALPSKENVMYINMLNGRDTIMPMAAMINRKALYKYNADCKVTKSLYYMILTLDYYGEPEDSIKGCFHMHPTDGSWTNRVQIASDKLYKELTSEFGEIINTSFNIHGQPIVFSDNDIIKAHEYQISRDVEDRVITLVVI